MEDQTIIYSPEDIKIKIIKWRVREGSPVNKSSIILLYEVCDNDDKTHKRLKCNRKGVVKRCLYETGAIVDEGSPILVLCKCAHSTIIKDMCGDCGMDLRLDENENRYSETAVYSMVHSMPDLKVTRKLAQEIAQADTKRLLEEKKLVLLVDLDQTLIHSTNDIVPNNIQGIYHFQLNGPNSLWYHTKLRPRTFEFLNNIAPYFELHICTFGSKNYAHTIAQILDPDKKFFSHRIVSRDECSNLTHKTDNLKSLFPCGDAMVCIIDDREDVWNMVSNLIQVKPYHFFQHSASSKNNLQIQNNDSQKDKGQAKSHKMNTNISTTATKGELENVKTEKHILETSKMKLKIDLNESTRPNTNGKCEDVSIEWNNGITPKKELDNKSFKEDNKNETQIPDECINRRSVIVNNKNENSVMEVDHQSVDEQKIENDQNGKLLEVEDPDEYLLYLESILKTIHTKFYEIYNEKNEIPDLKILIPKIKAEVLQGLHLVFSRLIPKQVKLEQSRAYSIAKSLGAEVTQDLTEQTTHLVAATAGTFKYNAARKCKNISIVTPDWLWCCAERWTRECEQLFPLNSETPSKMRSPPPHCYSLEQVIKYYRRPPRILTKSKPKFMDTINPLLSFSNDDLAEMNQEYDQFFGSDSSSEDDEHNSSDE